MVTPVPENLQQLEPSELIAVIEIPGLRIIFPLLSIFMFESPKELLVIHKGIKFGVPFPLTFPPAAVKVCQLANPDASEVKTLLAPSVPSDILILPITSSLATGVFVPIPTLSVSVFNLTIVPSSLQPPPIGDWDGIDWAIIIRVITKININPNKNKNH